jgi:hypothetical protein
LAFNQLRRARWLFAFAFKTIASQFAITLREVPLDPLSIGERLRIVSNFPDINAQSFSIIEGVQSHFMKWYRKLVGRKFDLTR